jgi:hypothetical protein
MHWSPRSDREPRRADFTTDRGCHAEAKELTLHHAASSAVVRRFVVRIVSHLEPAVKRPTAAAGHPM